MIRPRRTQLAAIAAVLWLAGTAQAGKMITYELTNTGGTSAPPVTQIFAYVHPAGSIGPDPNQIPPSTVSPFNVLPGSSGFNADNLISFLGDGTLNTGDPIQVLRLQFDNNGFAGPNASLKFSLDLNPAYKGPTPTLELVPGTAGVALASYTPPVAPPTTTTGGGTTSSGGTTPSTGGTTTPSTGGGSTSGGGTATVPEPMSIALWSVAAGLGLVRARAFRRGRKDLA